MNTNLAFTIWGYVAIILVPISLTLLVVGVFKKQRVYWMVAVASLLLLILAVVAIAVFVPRIGFELNGAI